MDLLEETGVKEYNMFIQFVNIFKDELDVTIEDRTHQALLILEVTKFILFDAFKNDSRLWRIAMIQMTNMKLVNCLAEEGLVHPAIDQEYINHIFTLFVNLNNNATGSHNIFNCNVSLYNTENAPVPESVVNNVTNSSADFIDKIKKIFQLMKTFVIIKNPELIQVMDEICKGVSMMKEMFPDLLIGNISETRSPDIDTMGTLVRVKSKSYSIENFDIKCHACNATIVLYNTASSSIARHMEICMSTVRSKSPDKGSKDNETLPRLTGAFKDMNMFNKHVGGILMETNRECIPVPGTRRNLYSCLICNYDIPKEQLLAHLSLDEHVSLKLEINLETISAIVPNGYKNMIIVTCYEDVCHCYICNCYMPIDTDIVSHINSDVHQEMEDLYYTFMDNSRKNDSYMHGIQGSYSDETPVYKQSPKKDNYMPRVQGRYSNLHTQSNKNDSYMHGIPGAYSDETTLYKQSPNNDSHMFGIQGRYSNLHMQPNKNDSYMHGIPGAYSDETTLYKQSPNTDSHMFGIQGRYSNLHMQPNKNDSYMPGIQGPSKFVKQQDRKSKRDRKTKWNKRHSDSDSNSEDEVEACDDENIIRKNRRTGSFFCAACNKRFKNTAAIDVHINTLQHRSEEEVYKRRHNLRSSDF